MITPINLNTSLNFLEWDIYSKIDQSMYTIPVARQLRTLSEVVYGKAYNEAM